MWRATIALSLLMQLVQFTQQQQQQAVQQYFISRRARPDTAPVQAGYVYTQMNNGPAAIKTFHSNHANAMKTGNGVADAEHLKMNKPVEVSTDTIKEVKNYKTLYEKFPVTTERSLVFSTESKLWPERDVNGKLKLAASSMVKSYEAIFRNDDEDIRTAFKNSYDVWPFFYQNIYDYKPKIGEIDVEKAKDKRYAVPTIAKIIPVHEMLDDTPDNNSVHKNNSKQYTKHTEAATTDNPIAGNQPFFSYVLNDYFDKTNEDVPTSYRDFSWGKEFEPEMGLQEIDDYAEGMEYVEQNNPINNREEKKKKTRMLEHDAIHESSNSKGRDSHRESESKKKGNGINHSYDGTHQYDGENYIGFKDFADSFAHRFGAEEHDKESSYAKKNNTDKGEKKKGFRTIYHKDEYQEHRDFFDNTDNSENVEEKGASKVRVGGSEAFLRSLAGAATAGEQNKISNTERIDKNHYERNHEDKQRNSGNEREIDQHRDVAKRTALSNNADYVDRYMI